MARHRDDPAALPCPDCGYDLRGNLPEDPERQVTCPECGFECSLAALETKNRERAPRNVGWIWIALVLVPSAILIGIPSVEDLGPSWDYGAAVSAQLTLALSPFWFAYLACRDLHLDDKLASKIGSFIIGFLSCIAINCGFLMLLFVLYIFACALFG